MDNVDILPIISHEENKVRICFHGWVLGNFILSFLAIYTALVPPTLPNCSLLCYGLGAICGLQILSHVDRYHISLSPGRESLRIATSIMLLILAAFFLYVGGISTGATFWLFPHPNILGRFWLAVPFYLPLFVYLPALLIACLLGCHGYLLLKGIYTQKALELAKNEERRRLLLGEWLSKVKPVTDEQAKSVQTLANLPGKIWDIDFLGALLKRIVVMGLWLIIPVWIFVIIPIQSFPSWRAISWSFLLGMAITVSVAIIWTVKLVITLGYRYCVNERGVLWRGLIGAKAIFWDELSGAFLYDGVLVLKRYRGPNWTICLLEVEKQEAFWLNMIQYLPLEILLISEEGWHYLCKTLRSSATQPPATAQGSTEHSDSFSNFISRYQKIWLNSEEQEEKKRKDKGRHKKNKNA